MEYSEWKKGPQAKDVEKELKKVREQMAQESGHGRQPQNVTQGSQAKALMALTDAVLYLVQQKQP